MRTPKMFYKNHNKTTPGTPPAFLFPSESELSDEELDKVAGGQNESDPTKWQETHEGTKEGEKP